MVVTFVADAIESWMLEPSRKAMLEVFVASLNLRAVFVMRSLAEMGTLGFWLMKAATLLE